MIATRKVLPAERNGVASKTPPLDAVSDGGNQDTRGRFKTGNKAACGNPFARRMAKLRSVLLDAVSEKDLQAVAGALVRQAKAGDVVAAKLLLSYTVGRPEAAVNPDRLELDELAIYREWPSVNECLTPLVDKIGAEAANQWLRNLEPMLWDALQRRLSTALDKRTAAATQGDALE
jgi:hypothetical protein